MGSYTMGIEFQCCKIKRVLQVGGHDDSTTSWVHIMPLNLKMFKTVHFTLSRFCHSLKKSISQVQSVSSVRKRNEVTGQRERGGSERGARRGVPEERPPEHDGNHGNAPASRRSGAACQAEWATVWRPPGGKELWVLEGQEEGRGKQGRPGPGRWVALPHNSSQCLAVTSPTCLSSFS